MARIVTCRAVSVYADALTRGRSYEVLDEDLPRHQLKVRGDNGRGRWFPCVCFDPEGRPAPTLVRWRCDEPPEDSVEVSLDLSDGTRRWLLLATPDGLSRMLGRPGAQPGLWARHLIIVRSFGTEDVDRILRELDQRGDLLDASLILDSDADEEGSGSLAS